MITLAEACALIVAECGGASVGAAQKKLREAGVSGEMRSKGVYLGRPYQLTPGDWRISSINFEADIFDQLGGLLPGQALALIGDVTVDEGDLRAWLRVKPRTDEDAAHKGGAPATVASPVKAWYEGKSEGYLRASDTALAASFKEENPESGGELDSIRKIIGGLRRARAKQRQLA
jgi:hypothetical protein